MWRYYDDHLSGFALVLSGELSLVAASGCWWVLSVGVCRGSGDSDGGPIVEGGGGGRMFLGIDRLWGLHSSGLVPLQVELKTWQQIRIGDDMWVMRRIRTGGVGRERFFKVCVR